MIRCNRCGNKDFLLALAWVYVNTKEFAYFDNDQNDIYCENCEDVVDTIEEDETT